MRTLPLAFVLAGLTACMVVPSGPPAKWHRTPPLRADRAKFLPAMEAVLAMRHFTVETRDERSVRLVSKWRVRLLPERYGGYRQRITMQLENDEKGEPVIAVLAERSSNEEHIRTLSESDASWGTPYGDDDMAREMALLLRMKIEGVRMDD
jgi:hypothetical protein